MANPESLRYTKTHEWLDLRGADGTVGITQYAQEEISDVVFVELPKVGTTVRAGQEVAVVESVKAAFSIYAPVAGAVASVNDRLRKEPALLNSSPHEDGWIFTMTLSDPAESAALLSHAQYQQWIAEEKNKSSGLHA